MLEPPLSRLSHEQLARIVEQLADDVDYDEEENLKHLSLVDRSFTLLCQSQLFKELRLEGSKSDMTRALKRVYEILKRKESSSVSFVRTIRLELDEQKDSSWLVQDQTFISLMLVLSKAPRPPHQLKIFDWNGSKAKNYQMITEGLARTFFSKSLTSMVIRSSQIPAETLLISPSLEHLDILRVSLIVDKISRNGENRRSTEVQLPKLRELDHRLSSDVVQRMLPRSSAQPIADLSQLRILRMCPEDEANMRLAQPILDVAYEALLKSEGVTDSDAQGYPLVARLLNLQRLNQLRVFELRSGIYDSDADRFEVVKDITEVLSTTPMSNDLARVYIRVQVFGSPPFRRMFDAVRAQEWRELAEEIVRIASGKQLRFELDMDTQNQEGDPLGGQESLPQGRLEGLYDYVEKEFEPLRKAKCINFDFQNEFTSDL